MLPSVPPLDPASVPWAVAAAAMAALDLAVLRSVVRVRDRPVRTSGAIFSAYFLAASAAFFGLLAASLSSSGAGAIGLALAALMLMMTAGGLGAVLLFTGIGERPVGPAAAWPLVLGGSLTLSELLMAAAFGIGVAPPGTVRPADLSEFGVDLLSAGTSLWFVGPMAATMGAFVVWAALGPIERGALGGLALTALAAPWVLADPLAGQLATAVGMVGTIGVTLAVPLPGRASGVRPAGFAILALAAMIPGEVVLGLWASAAGSAYPFSATMIGIMVADSAYLLRRAMAGPTRGTAETEQVRAATRLPERRADALAPQTKPGDAVQSAQ